MQILHTHIYLHFADGLSLLFGNNFKNLFDKINLNKILNII